ncbi:hypothetical protein M1N64_00270 [Peptococcaceae bacterium]|nr:hypothetical protein [Peptococcaceae bacterium]
MKQAIEENFILDVLQNYVTYKRFYEINKKIQEDPSFDKTKTTKAINRFVELHPTVISQKTEIIIEHFRNHSMKRIGGQAKAMLITSSRQHAVRYKLAFDKYIKDKKYTGLKTLVAFSQTVANEGISHTEVAMNEGISETKLPQEFDKDINKVLIIADKFKPVLTNLNYTLCMLIKS